jgi:GNAT superfamily N-acetyltransferase
MSPVPLTIEVLPAASADDAALVERIASLVNTVYETSEAGLWIDGARRTNERELANLIRRGQIAAAFSDGLIVGSVQVQQLDAVTGLFGMLVADPERRGVGIGRELVAFAERWAWDRGLTAMQLELLVPRSWSHPSKEFLRQWYERAGYRVVHTGRLDDDYPALAPQLATPCDLLIYRKDLSGDSTRK